MVEYGTGVFVAKCGCRFQVGDTAFGWEVDPGSGVFEIVAEIPDLEPPETPSLWALKNVIGPHEDVCLEMAEEGLMD